MTRTPAHRGARQRARAEITLAIKDAARRQLAVQGAQALSLRAVARELGMVSSALYRYFPSRDDLLTALIIDAYNSLGEAAETAVLRHEHPRAQWIEACHAVREWARRNPHEYLLVYGSPVPGYHAPQDTIGPAGRVPRALVAVLRTAVARDEITGDAKEELEAQDLPAALLPQLDIVAAALGEVSAPLLARGLAALTQLFGMIGFELTGQFTKSLDPADAFVSHTIERMADFVGLAPPCRNGE
ncbi:TetR/AcrR family transcriptional regulator [Saccharomonospora xinjiangensis]|uniref:TetR/AcrR family transcriptional regulator n=1 Tax=Saccharomonospora xinjiangensis TaxID=75294 RepID=UPI00106F2D61|nr:TetR/AcrR family transcriptional regulator [Saccharomonospora xinjiangensis]QBQ62432.1 putative HTH-type transcriptional regulator [Saccharomonospora xinjiangensis]